MSNFPRVCPHVEPPELGYLDWHADAEERHKRGERQLRCHNCGKCIWESFYLPFNYPTKSRFVCVTTPKAGKEQR